LRSIYRPAGVSAHAHVGDGHVGTIGNGGDAGWLRGVAEDIRLMGRILIFWPTLTMGLP
jgi:hypothetical protein